MNPRLLELAQEIHDRLSALIVPATAGSIRASSLSPERNPVLFILCLAGLLSFAVFICPIVVTAYNAAFNPGAAPLGNDLIDLLQIVGGAGLGSSFYALTTASRYIETRTFDAKYSNTYLIRFGLGLLAGLILAYFLKDIVNSALGANDNAGNTNSNIASIKKVSVSALALIGGYASEAVAQILNRIAETLVTLVSGSDKDKIDSERAKASADADKKVTQVVTDTVSELQKAISTQPPSDAVTAVRKSDAGSTDGKVRSRCDGASISEAQADAPDSPKTLPGMGA